MMRRYNRRWSRFDQPDPYDGSYDLSDPQSLNRYSYTQNDPVNFTDPTGLCMYAPMQIGEGGQIRWIPVLCNDTSALLMPEHIPYQEPLGPIVDPNDVGPPPIPVKNLAGNVADLLNGDCGKFVTSLIDAVAAATKNPAHSNDALSLFNTINGRQGGVVIENNLRLGGRVAGGTVSGAIGNSDSPPVIHIQISFLIAGSLTPAIISATQYTYAMTAIHETIHHAGKNVYYSDSELARAAHALTGVPGLPKDGADPFEWSGYWDRVLRDKCPPKRK